MMQKFKMISECADCEFLRSSENCDLKINCCNYRWRKRTGSTSTRVVRVWTSYRNTVVHSSTRPPIDEPTHPDRQEEYGSPAPYLFTVASLFKPICDCLMFRSISKLSPCRPFFDLSIVHNPEHNHRFLYCFFVAVSSSPPR